MDNCYKIVNIESGTDYKPVRKKSINTTYYDKYPICKFLCTSVPSGEVKIWTIGVDVNDADEAISVPATAFVAGNVYDITVGKMEFSDGSFLGYFALGIPLDFPEKNV